MVLCRAAMHKLHRLAMETCLSHCAACCLPTQQDMLRRDVNHLIRLAYRRT